MSIKLVSSKAIITPSLVEVITYFSLPKVAKMPNKCYKRYFLGNTGIRLDNILRTKSKIKRLVRSNPDLCKFLSFTFRDNIKENTELKKTNKKFNKFIEKMRKRFPDFKYICIPEYQKDYYHRTGEKKKFGGTVHYHMLVNIKEKIDVKELEKIWSHGFVNARKLKNDTNLALYLVKYLSKDINKKFFARRRYFYSNNCNKPKVLTGISIFDIMKLVQNLKQVFSKEINFSWGSICYYHQYSYT